MSQRVQSRNQSRQQPKTHSQAASPTEVPSARHAISTVSTSRGRPRFGCLLARRCCFAVLCSWRRRCALLFSSVARLRFSFSLPFRAALSALWCGVCLMSKCARSQPSVRAEARHEQASTRSRRSLTHIAASTLRASASAPASAARRKSCREVESSKAGTSKKSMRQ